MKYSIVTGYWCGEGGFRGGDTTSKAEFFELWLSNTLKYSEPSRIFVINPNSLVLPTDLHENTCSWIHLDHNFGHVHDMHGSDYRHKFCGWTQSFILGAMLAYANNTDLIYKEQDCLAFGPWVQRLYEDMEKNGKKMLLGMESFPGMRIEQSLVIIKHDFINEFLKELFDIPFPDGGLGKVLPEAKFAAIMDKRKEVGYMSFGVGRARPILFDAPFYVQQLSKEEIDFLKNIGLV